MDSESSDGEYEHETVATTPMTPASLSASPRYPSDLKTHYCSFIGCDKVFNRPAKLAQHLRSHTNTRPFVCPHVPCDKDFLRQSHLKHHIKSAHSSIREYVCGWDGCDKEFVTATRLKRHHAAHEGREKFKCSAEGCGQTFRKHGTLQKHITVIHIGKKPFICNVADEKGRICDSGFDTSSKLRSHQGRAHGGQRFWCSICPSLTPESPPCSSARPETPCCGFSTYAALQEHIKIEHPPTCAQCELKCCSQRELKNHIDIRHGENNIDVRKTHLCLEANCVRAFTKKGNLNVHVQSVHRAKKFVCGAVDLKSLNNIGGWDGHNACGQSLSTKGNLEEHIRKKHRFVNHDNQNQGPKKRKRQQKMVSAITRLTGVGYEGESGRTIVCLFPECQFRFFKHHDLELHLRSRHGLTEQDVRALFQRDEGSFSHQGWDGSLVPATRQDLQAERALDKFTCHNTPEYQTKECEAAACAKNGEEFWLGGAFFGLDNKGDWLLSETGSERV